MIFIHPPLAIAGYVFIYLFTVLLFFRRRIQARSTRFIGVGAWLLTFLGLVTGMIWAAIAWGSYWSWDPKETLTLVLFLAVSAGQAVYFEKHFRLAKWLSVFSCAMVVITASSTYLIAGLHSFFS
jgi:ABC-type transport system involved in cytochrome c biogenesis permease subunit